MHILKRYLKSRVCLSIVSDQRSLRSGKFDQSSARSERGDHGLFIDCTMV